MPEPEQRPELRPADEVPIMGREAPLPAYGTLKRGKKATAGESLSVPGGGPTGKGEITLVVDDPESAGGAIEETVTRLGGRINGHSSSEESHLLIIRIGVQKVAVLLDRLERIGTVQEKPQISKGAGGTVDLTIKW